MAFWLRHKTGSTTVSRRFDGLRLIDAENVKRENTTALNGMEYDHKFYTKREWDLVVSANELAGLANTGKLFLKAFWSGDERWINLSTAADEPVGSWIHVVSDGGRLPEEFIKGNKKLPEVKLTLRESLRA